MTNVYSNFMGETAGGQLGTKAEIVRKEIMFGNIRIRCPMDQTEYEVPATIKEFICPTSNEKLFISL